VFDPAAALVNTNNSQTLLLRILNQTLTNTPQRLNNLQHFIEQQQWNDATREAHTLKSVFGSIGAKKLQQLCADYEAYFSTEPDNVAHGLDDISPHYQHLSTRITAYIAEISHVTHSLDEPLIGDLSTSHETPLADCVPMLERLLVLVDEYDIDAGELSLTLVEHLKHTHFNVAMSDIEKQISGYHYDGATQQLKALLKEIQQQLES
jgi:HPt (histidine-containing phosphotransfer) domain-containing protein